MTTLSIGIAAHMGWVATTTVEITGNDLRVLRTDRINTAEPGDREALEPYHVAGGFDGLNRVPPPDNPAATVELGLKRQRRTTSTAFAALLQACNDVSLAAILTGRGRLAPSLDKVLASHAQIHVAEGLAVRDSVRTALQSQGVTVTDVDSKSLFDRVRAELGRDETAALSYLAARRPDNGGAWRKEQKLAALAAWLAATAA